ncbi:hypothetical protein LGH70_15965 [Hymenobacter sp. BT635]|uniref:DUF4279 domain-containing protein n=1 Tax=Hymenobacter nitidus TaxID=2880929 RepID=A0ABS8AFF3_9BACT|nr:DUF4279 domain-containing protein [Hymenobacter nitidus]MCB2379097.1 hypothetical protein [Hymenobacter nitidus]
MSRNLQFSATNFDVESLRGGLELELEEIHKQGEPLYVGGPPYSNSGFLITYSKADFDSFQQQIEDAIAFIKKHKHDLKLLGDLKASLPDSEYVFCFCIHTRMSNDYLQEDQFPNELLKLLGEIGAGLSLTQFHPYTPEEEGEEESNY